MTTIEWTREKFVADHLVLDEVLTGTTSDGDNLMIASYPRDRSKFVLTVETRDLGPFSSVQDAKEAANVL